jgi:hypothetical protein
MKAQIYCKTTGKGEHTFYLWADGMEYYLFRQAYRKGVHAYFRNGIRLEEAYDFSKARNDNAIIRTLCKLPVHIKYIENEYGIAVLKQTQKRNQCARTSEKISA